MSELDDSPAVLEHTENLHHALHHLLALFRAARSDHRLNHASFRLEILRQAHEVVRLMNSNFGLSRSGLFRLYSVGQEIENSETWTLLRSILDYEGDSAKPCGGRARLFTSRD